MKAPIAVRGLARRALPFATRSLGSVKGAATEDPVAALTFDDGPHPDHTPEILDVLRSHNAKATFFFIAHRVIDYPDLAFRSNFRIYEYGGKYWLISHGPGFPLSDRLDGIG